MLNKLLISASCCECGMSASNGVDFLLTLPELNNIQVISMVLLAYLFSLGFP